MDKRKLGIWELICISAIPWPFIFTYALIKLKELSQVYIWGKSPPVYSTFADYKPFLPIVLAGWGCVIFLNIERLHRGKKVSLLSWMFRTDYEPVKVTSRKRKAMCPDIDEKYLSDDTEGGIIVGKQIGGKKFVRYPITEDSNTLAGALFCGGPGSGKTTLMITTILEILKGKNTISCLIIDVKPEFFDKTSTKSDPRTRVLNPFDRMTYGYNLYYGITEDSTDDEIMSELDAICNSLIDTPKDSRDKFFYESGRNIAEAVLFYRLKTDMMAGRASTFMDGMDLLLGDDTASLVKKILEDIADKPEFFRVRKLLKPYANKDGEAFQSIEMTIRQSLKVFTYNNIQWFFGDNPKMASPYDLESGNNMYLCLPEYYLDDYYMVLKTISESVIRYCSRRPDCPKRKILLYLDEFPRLHLSAEVVLQGIALGRSRGLITILAAQTMQQIMSAWKREQALAVSDLCQIECFLSCADKESAQLICDWAGSYNEEHIQYSESYKSTSYSRSFSEKNILEPSDLMDLQEKAEAVVFIKGKYMRVDVVGARYYNRPELNKISQECLAVNCPKED